MALLCIYTILFGGPLEGIIRFDLRLVSILSLTVLFAAWLVWQGFRRAWQPTRADLIAVLWMVAIGLSWLANGLLSRRSMTGAWFEGLALAVLLMISQLVRQGLPRRWPMNGVLATGGVAVIEGWGQLFGWFGGWLRFRSLGMLFSPLRPPSLLGNTNTFATLLIVLLPLIGIHIWCARRWTSRALWIIFGLASGLLLLFTQSRGAWLGLGAAISVILGLLAVAHGAAWRAWFTPRRVMAAAIIVLLFGGATAVFATRLIGDSKQSDGRAGIYQVAFQAFLSSPLVGHGPDSFSGQLMHAQSIPPEPPHSHAHDIPLHIAAELGIVGLLAASFSLFLILRSFHGQFMLGHSAERIELIGLAAALIAYVVHGLFDVTAAQPAILLLGIILLGALLGGEAHLPIRTANWRLAPVALLCTVLVLTGIGATFNYQFYADSLDQAASGDRSTAAILLEQAANLDPYSSASWSAAGYAFGELAARGDRQALLGAIRDFEQSARLEPENAWTWLNLAVLQAQNGDRDGALRSSQQAARYAPLDNLVLLNRALLLERFSQPSEAQTIYQGILNRDPSLALDAFWQATALRQVLAAPFLAAPDPYGFAPLETLLKNGQFDAARAEVARQKAASNGPQAFINAALVELAAHGELNLAEQNLDAARFLGAQYGSSSAWLHYALSELAAARGDTLTRDQERAAASHDTWSEDGLTLPYNGNIPIATYFQRPYPVTLLPQVWFPSAPAEVLRLLAESEARPD